MFIHIVQVQCAYVGLREAAFVLQKVLQPELLLLCLFKPLSAFSGAARIDINLSASFYGALGSLPWMLHVSAGVLQ